MKSPSPLILLSISVLLSLSASVPGAEQPRPRQIRVAGPDTLQQGMRYALAVEGLRDGTNWELLAPDQFRVKVSGSARALDDPAGRPMNPFEIRCEDVADGKVTIEITVGDQAVTRTFAVGTAKPMGTFEAVIQPRTVTHRFAGLGGGVMFYDNQFDITTGDDIYDWCFRDVHATFLHVLIRPGYEKENDNEDWRSLDLAKFDFQSLERPFRIIKKALERNPKLKIYASLYSPPAWLKANNSTGGQGSLKDGLRSCQELAEYVFAYLKHARSQGIPVHYLGFFNEPDFQHTQEGMYFADLGTLVETFSQCARALDTLLAADPTMKERPTYVFPDSLGAGSITRAGRNSQRIRQRVRLLDRVGVWGVHDYWNQAGTYWNDRFRELRAFPGVGKKPIWMTEWAQRFPRGDLASGVEFGVHILNALRLGAEAWMVFEWCHPSGNQSGLLSTDWGEGTALPLLAEQGVPRFPPDRQHDAGRGAGRLDERAPQGGQFAQGRWRGVSGPAGRGQHHRSPDESRAGAGRLPDQSRRGERQGRGVVDDTVGRHGGGGGRGADGRPAGRYLHGSRSDPRQHALIVRASRRGKVSMTDSSSEGTLTLRGEHITLAHAVKAVGLADSGGQAKHLVRGGSVTVNGEATTQPGRKLRVGDRFGIAGGPEWTISA